MQLQVSHAPYPAIHPCPCPVKHKPFPCLLSLLESRKLSSFMTFTLWFYCGRVVMLYSALFSCAALPCCIHHVPLVITPTCQVSHEPAHCPRHNHVHQSVMGEGVYLRVRQKQVCVLCDADSMGMCSRECRGEGGGDTSVCGGSSVVVRECRGEGGGTPACAAGASLGATCTCLSAAPV